MPDNVRSHSTEISRQRSERTETRFWLADITTTSTIARSVRGMDKRFWQSAPDDIKVICVDELD
jgi:hypothetical protein